MQIGGTTLGEVASFAADVSMAISDRLSLEAATAGKIGSYARRTQDWTFQSNLAAGEICQIFRGSVSTAAPSRVGMPSDSSGIPREYSIRKM